MTRQKNLRILSEDEIRKLLSTIKNDTDQMIVEVCLNHGLRNLETMSLKKKHIDFDTRRIEIIDSKNDKDRQVPIPDHFEKKLENWVGDLSHEDYLFPSPVFPDQHLTTRYFQKLMHRVCLSAGLYPDEIQSVEEVTVKLDRQERITPHSLRHTYATRLLRNGTPMGKVKKLLGHSSVKTTIDTYQHLTIEDTRPHINAITY